MAPRHEIIKEDINADNKILDANFDRKLDLILEGSQPHVREHLLTHITHINCQIIMAYLLTFMTEVNPKVGYRIQTILKLKT